MSYQPLARKYRPKLFAELVGQDAVSLALANAISRGSPPPVILFTGIRGVGKTTVARLYAKALNCELRGANAEPCNTCESCVAIGRGVHEDVVEIDGASNTGVGDVRALQETLEYVPQRKKYKVYIIDEVHMLSQAAFNALLKTLEEPRSHVVFIFATTEVQKVPQTILSRCQTFYLKKLPLALIRERLAVILAQEGIEAEAKALSIVAREGHGSMRDALTLLDQAIALGAGRVSMEALGSVVSNLSSSPYLELLDAMVRRDAKAALDVIERLDGAGAEFAPVTEELAGFARHAFVLRDLGPKALDAALIGLDDTELTRLRQTAEAAGSFDLNRIFRTLVKCRTELDGSALDRYVLENYIFEWCFDPGMPDVDSLLAGFVPSPAPAASAGAGSSQQARSPEATAKLGNSLREAAAHGASSGKPVEAIAAKTGPAPSAREDSAMGASSEPKSVERAGEVGFPETWRQLVEAWKREKPFQARKLEEAHPVEFSKESIVLAVSEESYASKVLLHHEEQIKIRDQFKEVFGFTGLLQVVKRSEALKSQNRAGAESASPQAPATSDELVAAEELEALPETILVERTREAAQKREHIIREARNAPFTKELLAELGGRIEAVRVTGDAP